MLTDFVATEFSCHRSGGGVTNNRRSYKAVRNDVRVKRLQIIDDVRSARSDSRFLLRALGRGQAPGCSTFRYRLFFHGDHFRWSTRTDFLERRHGPTPVKVIRVCKSNL